MRKNKSFICLLIALIGLLSGLYLEAAPKNVSSRTRLIEDRRGSQGVNFGLNPKEDSLFIARMNVRMDSIRQTRPTVGLVLSGGGAKGTAHVGVIKYLEEKKIPVDFVLGTSMGGLVGGIYAMGYSPAQMDSIVRNMDWFFDMTDKIPRKYIPYSEIKYSEKYLLSLPFHYDLRQSDSLDVQYALNREILASPNDSTLIQGDKLKNDLKHFIPSGIVYGHNVNNVIKGLSIGYHESQLDFMDLPIPFACIATDLVSGKGKIWHSGSLPLALRSTMSVPGVFAPVKMNGMVLIDGGMRDNFPTDLAKRLGADIVIGVDVSAGYHDFNEINNLVDIFNAGVSMMGRESYELNVSIPDVTIRPDISGMGMMSFDKTSLDTLLTRGYAAAVAKESVLDSLKSVIGPSSKSFYAPSALNSFKDSIFVEQVVFHGVHAKESALLFKMLPFKVGTFVTRDQIEAMEAKMIAMGTYEYTSYSLTYNPEDELLESNSASSTNPDPFISKKYNSPELNRRKYTVNFFSKHGPVHKLGVGLRFDSEEMLSALINLGFNVNKIRGVRHNLEFRLSTNPIINYVASYDSPKTPTFNFALKNKWNDMHILDFSRGRRLNMRFFHGSQEFYFSNMKFKWMDIRLGLSNDIWYFPDGKAAITGHPQPIYCNNDKWTDYLNLFLDARGDTFDNGYFPTRGFRGGFNYKWTFSRWPQHTDVSLENFHSISADIMGAVSICDWATWLPKAQISVLLGQQMPLVYGNFIGGEMRGRYVDQQIPFIGVNGCYSMKPFLALLGMDLRFQVAKNHYLSGTLDYARDGVSFHDFFKDQLGYFGVAAKYSYNSIIGPISFNMHWSNLAPPKHRFGVYISLGLSF